MDFSHAAAAGLAVQAVDVLGDHVLQEPHLFQLGQSGVARIGLVGVVISDKIPPDAPVPGRVFAEHLDRGVHRRVELLPEPAPGPEGRDPALGRYAGPREGHTGLLANDQVGDLCEGGFHSVLITARLNPHQ